MVIYRNSLEELLSPLVLSDSQLYQLLEETNGSAWETPDLVSSLRDRLGHNYLPFKSSIKQLNKKVVLFGHKLQLDDKLKPSWVSDSGHIDTKARDSFFKHPLNRIRGGFNSEKYKQLLLLVQDDINRIATLTSGAIALEPLRLDRKQKANAAYWTRFPIHAQQLYECLNSRWSSQCHCQCPHEASLRLELHKDASNRAAIFKILFSFDKDLATSNLPWDWRAVEIEPSEDTNRITTQRAQVSPRIIVHSAPGTQRSWIRCMQAAPKISDLCKALKDGARTACCIGVLDDVAFKHHIHSAVLPNVQENNHKRTTLQDILEKRAGIGFQIKEKCTLALTLADAVLQLHDTPWLGETWSTKDIFILSHGQTPILLSQPYVSKSFTSPTNATQFCGSKHRIIKNATVFALGIALLEISYGRRLITFETPDDLDDHGNRTLLTDYLIADRLVESIHTRELPNFANAARRCVHCNFDGVVYSLKNDSFRENFYQGVIVPLQQDYDYATMPVVSA
ncbi:hypothetical protein BDV95DRAFT_610791 [Massariosphaeria phaeospora]|uniref:DUF7580 domain-containing protein n=1 Tax=Massariosphaeria phaeospora TaxID=100035 RepID=A0A7C8I7U6_9PLEO|nr:hypothetical protein BDV95DRAFT_610791 [Massariosphaeria phaeospora]